VLRSIDVAAGILRKAQGQTIGMDCHDGEQHAGAF
jgi:hypothetical protein